ncbi:MAG: hypothetical protein JWL81_2773 [Verrucomicrobiales bacterium]|nr:hypothetical protein [Verrucomicrobiales bacterium]
MNCFPRQFLLLSLGLALLAWPGFSQAQPPVLERLYVPDAVADVRAEVVYLPVQLSYTAPDMLRRVDMVCTSAAGDTFYSSTGILHSPAGGGEKVLRGSARSGTYQGWIRVPAHRAAGTWTIAAVLHDFVNPPVYYGAENTELGIPAGSPPLPAGSTFSITLINPEPPDETPPQLSSFSVTPNPVDVTTGSRTVTVTAAASDNRGISTISVFLPNSEGGIISWASMSAEQRISGDELSGVYRAELTVPGLLAPGAYPLQVSVTDTASRSLSYGYHGSPVPGPGVETTLMIGNTGAVDSAPPDLLAVSTDRQTVNLTGAGTPVAFLFSGAQTLSGIRTVEARLHRMDGSATGFGGVLYSGYSTPLEKSLEQRTGNIYLPITLPSGEYRWRIIMSGASPHYRTSYYGLPGDRPFPGGFTGVMTVTNSISVEQNRPVVTGITLSPDHQAFHHSTSVVEITAEVGDDTGVTGVSAYLIRESPLAIISSRDAIPLTLVRGTAKAGLWRVRKQMNLELGVNVLRVSVVDASRNVRNYQDVFWDNDFLSPDSATIPMGWSSRYSVKEGEPEGEAVDPYAVWRRGYTGLAGAAGDLAADADGDGISNALEFFCDTDPLLPSQPGGPDPAAARAPRLVAGGWELEPGGLNNHLGWGPAMVLSGWKSSTLLPGSWEPVTPVTVSGKQRYLLDPPAPGRPQQFLRLTVGP